VLRSITSDQVEWVSDQCIILSYEYGGLCS
jgi:hypothetical protein